MTDSFTSEPLHEGMDATADARAAKLKGWWDERKNRDKVMMACIALLAVAVILAVLNRAALMSNPLQAVQDAGYVCMQNMSAVFGG